MKIFVSSANITFDQNQDITFLEPNNIDQVTKRDIVIGSSTFMDELLLKSLMERGMLPFVVTINKKTSHTPIFKYMTLCLKVESYDITDELLETIMHIKADITQLEEYIDEDEKEIVNKNLLEELLLNYNTFMSHTFDSGVKGGASQDEYEKQIYIHYKENKNTSTKIIYVFLYDNGKFRVFSKTVDIDFSLNKRAMKNSFMKEFSRLLGKESQQEHDGFKDITLGYGSKFLLLEKINERYLLIDTVPTVDFFLKLYRQIDFERLVIYPIMSRNTHINEEKIKMLSSISKYLNQKNHMMLNIKPLLQGKNLFYSYDKYAYENIVAEVFEKFLDKIDKSTEEKVPSSFDLSINLLKEGFENIEQDKSVLTNIFYNISDGINVQRVIKKQFTQYMSNFTKYKKSLKKAEVFIENEGEYQHIIDFIEESSLDINQRVNEIDYVYNVLKCLDDRNELKKGVTNLYQQLLKLDLPSTDEYSDEYGFDYEGFIKKKYDNFEYKRFIRAMIGAMFRMEGNLSSKKVSKLIVFMFYHLSKEEDIHLDCFLSFSYIYADNFSTQFLIEYLYEFFKSKRDNIEEYLRENLDNYKCKIVKNDVEIITKIENNEPIIIKYKTLEKRRNKAIKSLQVIGSFYKSIFDENSISEIIITITDKIIKDDLDSKIYCQLETTLNYLALFISCKDCCEKNLDNFFNNFQKELASS